MTIKKLMLYLFFFCLGMYLLPNILGYYSGYKFHQNAINDTKSEIVYDFNYNKKIKGIYGINDYSFKVYFGNIGNNYLPIYNKIYIENSVKDSEETKKLGFDPTISHEIIHYRLKNLSFIDRYKLIKRLKENEILISNEIKKYEEIKEIGKEKIDKKYSTEFFIKLLGIEDTLKNKRKDERFNEILEKYEKHIAIGKTKSTLELSYTKNFLVYDEYVAYFFEYNFNAESRSFEIPDNVNKEKHKYNDNMLKIYDNYVFFEYLLNKK